MIKKIQKSLLPLRPDTVSHASGYLLTYFSFSPYDFVSLLRTLEKSMEHFPPDIPMGMVASKP